ncbi:hypothetical protein EPN83_02215 [Patescibacteria group bacterium]|nr:MAG: hypothetical protein EPN83_02215 [Patescibacteria group bacterium]
MPYPHTEKIKKRLEGYADFIVKDGLNYLIPRWEKITEDVEMEDDIYEYTNNLDVRSAIDIVLTELSSEEQKEVEKKLVLPDSLFEEKTIKIKENICGLAHEQKHNLTREKNWYYYRAPKSLIDANPDIQSV